MTRAAVHLSDVVLLDNSLAPGQELLADGRTLARDWRVGPSLFLTQFGISSELALKQALLTEGRIMQHAQIGYRDPEKTKRAAQKIYEDSLCERVEIHRFGVCLDWTMALPREEREKSTTGTGLLLKDVEDFVALGATVPVAMHFGDFVLGFPAAVENTKAALAAGSTAIGNLGQYFMFRIPGHDDDVRATRETVRALGLIAAQDEEILVHSNLDDGFAAQFADLTSVLGAALIEKYIVEELVGANLGICYGHHFSDPIKRLAFHVALAQVFETPGTMIYGNTTSYRGSAAQNYASLANYLLADIVGQRRVPTGHAINPVPVLENKRIPDVDEIINAQLFAGRLIEHGEALDDLIDISTSEVMAQHILSGGQQFRDAVLNGLGERGVDLTDAGQLLLALRRIGGRHLEQLFGVGPPDHMAPHQRLPLVRSSLFDELECMANVEIDTICEDDQAKLRAAGLKVLVAATDVHEHGKHLLEKVFRKLGIAIIDGGVTAGPKGLAERASIMCPDMIAVSTYNGISLKFANELTAALSARAIYIPVVFGGRLNEVPASSNTSLPVDVSNHLIDLGIVPCCNVAEAVDILLQHSQSLAHEKNS